MASTVAWWLTLILPIVVAVPFLLNIVELSATRPYASPCLGVTIITAGYWIFEPIPIVISAFFPIFLLPLFSICDAKVIASSMFADTSLIFMGGFIFSIAMVRWNLHSRIALKTVLIFGLRPAVLLFGISLVTWFFGFFISNTATALTMVPNAMAIITKLEESTNSPEALEPFSKALLLSVAFTASIGGMKVITGTPPNLFLAQTAAKEFPNGEPIGYTDFLFVGLPLSLALLAFEYLYFYFFYLRKMKVSQVLSTDSFKENYDRLGKMSPPEKVISVLFVVLALLWLFRSDVNFGSFTLKGWSTLIYSPANKAKVLDGTVAIAISMLLFIIKVPPPSVETTIKLERAEIDLELRANPIKQHRYHSPLDIASSDDLSDDSITIEDQAPQDQKWIPVLEWEYTQQKMPWTILFLFSGGFALSQGFTDSGLDQWIGEKLGGITEMALVWLLVVVCVVSILMTNLVASNTACANILLPVVAAIAKQSKIVHPYLLMMPTAFSTGASFILPIATPPNLIAFSTGRLKTSDFIVAGGILTVASVVLIPLICYLLIRPVYDAYEYPSWG